MTPLRLAVVSLCLRSIPVSDPLWLFLIKMFPTILPWVHNINFVSLPSGVTESLLFLFFGDGGAKGGDRPSSGGRGQEDGIAMIYCAQSKVKWGVQWGGGGHGVNGEGAMAPTRPPSIVTPLSLPQHRFACKFVIIVCAYSSTLSWAQHPNYTKQQASKWKKTRCSGVIPNRWKLKHRIK